MRADELRLPFGAKMMAISHAPPPRRATAFARAAAKMRRKNAAQALHTDARRDCHLAAHFIGLILEFYDLQKHTLLF